jgi:hypothetical protein
MTPDIVGWIEDARELMSVGPGNVMDDIDWIRDVGELIPDELGNTMSVAGDEELWLPPDIDTDVDEDAEDTAMLEATSGIRAVDDMTIGVSSEGCEAGTELEAPTEVVMISVVDTDTDVGVALLTAAVRLILVSGKLLADVGWTDPAFRVLVPNTGTDSEIESREVDDAIGLAITIPDDSAWKMLEVTPLLDNNIVGVLMSGVICTLSEVNTAWDALDVICETVSGSPIVVDEISGAIVATDVCTYGALSLERLALMVVLSGDSIEPDDRVADSESMIDEVGKDSIVDVGEIDTMSGLVVVVSRIVWLTKGTEDAAGVPISEIELTLVGMTSIADDFEMLEGVEMTMAKDGISTLDGVSKDVATGSNVAGSVGRLMAESTEDSTIAEFDMVILLARLDSGSVKIESEGPGRLMDTDVVGASVDVSRVMLMSSEAIEAVVAEGSELAGAVGASTALKLEGTAVGDSKDEA